MQAAVNYCSSDLGAKIAESSSNSANPEGVLSEREDSLWSGKAEDVIEKPFVIIQLPPHPAIRFVGWHVWQDYSSNPKVVEISAGMSPNALTDVVHCTALQGPGIQLWELSTPISSAYSYVRFRIVATFGSASTYMNRIFTFSNRPPEPSGAPVTMSPQLQQHSSSSLATTFGNNNSMSMPGQQNTSTNVPSSAILASTTFGGGGSGGMNSSTVAPADPATTRMMSNSHHFPRSASAVAGGASTSLSRPPPFGTSGGNLDNSAAAAASAPPPSYSADPRASITAFEAGSPMHMSEMLKELDEDIRLLHPLPVEGLVAKTAAAANRGSVSRPVSPSRVGGNISSSSNNNPTTNLFPNSSSQNDNKSGILTNTNTNPNASNVLNASNITGGGGGGGEIDELRREIRDLRSLVVRNQSRSGSGSPQAENPSSRSFSSAGAASSNFPQEELASLVDDIMQPKLMKWARKLESRILLKVDETLKDLLGQITAAIDARVEQHMKHVIQQHHKEYGPEDCHLCRHQKSHVEHSHKYHNHGRGEQQAVDSTSRSAAAAAQEEYTDDEIQQQQRQNRHSSKSSKKR